MITLQGIYKTEDKKSGNGKSACTQKEYDTIDTHPLLEPICMDILQQLPQ